MTRRVHLAVVVDPGSGRRSLSLTQPPFQEPWQNRLVAATANTAFALFTRRGAASEMIALARKVMASTSTLVDGLLAQAPDGAVACRAGCDHCCRQSVGVTPPELLAIVSHLTETRTETELSSLRIKVSQLAQRTRGLTSRERIAKDLPCPLLEHGRCSVYEVRPLSCRGMNSLDASICEQKLSEGPIRDAFFEGTLEGHVFVEPIRAFHAISAGLQLALSECFGLDMRPLDLTAALDLVLSSRAGARPPSTKPLEDWLQGKSSLESARGGDASQNSEHWALAGAASPGSPTS